MEQASVATSQRPAVGWVPKLYGVQVSAGTTDYFSPMETSNDFIRLAHRQTGYTADHPMACSPTASPDLNHTDGRIMLSVPTLGLSSLLFILISQLAMSFCKISPTLLMISVLSYFNHSK